MAKLERENVPYTQVANEILYDKELTLKSKGLYAYMFAKPNSWDFSSDRIAKECKDGREGVQSSIRELIKVGYLVKKKLGTGRIVYTLKHSKPKSANPTLDMEDPKSGKPTVGKPHSGESPLIIKKEIDKERDNINKEIGEVIKSFELINPACKKMYGHKPQREACENLIESYGFEKVKRVIDNTLPITNKVPYFPTITTPMQLREKWSSLEANIIKYKGKTDKKSVGIIT